MSGSHFIYSADDRTHSWINQGALLPTVLIQDHCYRVFVGFLDKAGISRIGFVDLDKRIPTKILQVSQKPVLDIGEAGCFDDNGVVPVSLLHNGSNIHLYYVGFQLGVRIPYFMFLGLAISIDNGKSFQRISKVPILERNNQELFARCGAHVQIFNNKWHMWYIGSLNEGWIENNQGKKLPLYSMRHATSDNGIDWQIDSSNCLQHTHDEHGFGRAHVIEEKGVYKMFFSSRRLSNGYSLSYAESQDLLTWTRKDHPCLNIMSDSSWDKLHKSYPFLIKEQESYLIFYNGNNCGKDGFGYTRISRESI